MVDTLLIQYGVLGLWLITLLRQQYIFDNTLRKLIEANTNATIQNNLYLEENKTLLQCIKDKLKIKR